MFQRKGILFCFLNVSEEGLALGFWMSKQPKPVKMPVILKKSDDGKKALLKMAIRNMLCPDPAHRCSIQLFSDTLRAHYGKFYYHQEIKFMF